MLIKIFLFLGLNQPDLAGLHADNEHQWLQLLAAGNEQAFTGLYNRHYAHIYYFAKSIVDEETAKDITITVFTELWQKRPVLESGPHLVAWLRKVTRNACIDRLRRQKAETGRQSEILRLSDESYEDQHFRDIMEAELFRMIHEEVEKLPGHLKAIFKLAYYEGLKNPEIAERLSIKDASVRTGKAEALKLLRLALLQTDLPFGLVMLALNFPDFFT